MSAAAIGGSSSNQVQSNAFSKLKSEDFLKVMMSELQNQDPFQPQDSSKLLEQFSNLRNIESQMQLESSLQSLVLQNQLSAAGGMINKVVKGLTLENDAVEGQVTSVRVQDNKVLLELDNGQTLRMDRVTEIKMPDGTPVSGNNSQDLSQLIDSVLGGNKTNSTTPATSGVA